MFKKTLGLMMAAIMVFALAACGQTPAQNSDNQASFDSAVSSEAPETEPSETETPTSAEGEQTESADGKTLVVYFSWSGNTENVANSIKDQIGSDIFEIVPQTSYSDDYDTVVDLAREEQRTDARPEISGSIDNIAQCDVIYVGYPNWWGDMPMILYTFFDTYDLSGKTVVPFVTSGGSGFSDTISTIRRLESGASVLEGLSLISSLASDPGSDVADWLTGLGLVK